MLVVSHDICDGISAGDGANKSNFEEYLMSLRLSERCHKVSIWYAESMKKSDSRHEAWFKKLMDGCPEKYFDVDSIGALHFNNRGEAYPWNIYNTKSFEETIMSEPLRSRCPKVSTCNYFKIT
ncbi:hypothetical protein ACJIZ3_014228 [Penstemon smallii]|uniref:Uncharacterized protein n=1 Tax=Penstemon smallii TaxID=265156 RepID=A0ABD3RIY6_9LAMI